MNSLVELRSCPSALFGGIDTAARYDAYQDAGEYWVVNPEKSSNSHFTSRIRRSTTKKTRNTRKKANKEA